MTKYYFPKGSKKSRPLRFCAGWNKSNETVGVVVNQGEEAIYTLPYPDNEDLWKVIGRSFDMATNHKNSYMVASRWFPEQNKFGYTTYYHKDGDVYIGPTEVKFERNLVNAMSNKFARVTSPMASAYYELLGSVEFIVMADVGEPVVIDEIRSYQHGEYGFRFFNPTGELHGSHYMKFKPRKFFRKIYPWGGGTLPTSLYGEVRFEMHGW